MENPVPEPSRSKCAGEIMIPLEDYPHVGQSATLVHALRTMEAFQIEVGGRKSLPRVVLVFDDSHQRLLGVVRRRDILRGLDPEFLAGVLLGRPAGSADGRLVDALRQRAARPVSDVMNPVRLTVNYNDHIVTVIDHILENDLYLIPVLRGGEVVGVVRTVDVLGEISKLLGE